MKHIYNGMEWASVGWCWHEKKDGREVQLHVWKSACVECGAPIFCRTPVDFCTSRAFGLRRGTEHKAK